MTGPLEQKVSRTRLLQLTPGRRSGEGRRKWRPLPLRPTPASVAPTPRAATRQAALGLKDVRPQDPLGVRRLRVRSTIAPDTNAFPPQVRTRGRSDWRGPSTLEPLLDRLRPSRGPPSGVHRCHRSSYTKP